MDQLDILKKDWDTQNTSYPKYSKEDLKGMLAVKSTSIVKWLLIIAIIEFIVMTGLNVLFSVMGEPDETTEALMHSGFMKAVNVVHIIAVIYFIYLFYRNYKNISATQPTSSLMKNIIKTRKTMKWYIWYNIIGGFVSGMIGTIFILNNHPEITEIVESGNLPISDTTFYIMAFLFMVVFYVVLLGLLYLFYMLIYGILLKRLKNNYLELKKMEV